MQFSTDLVFQTVNYYNIFGFVITTGYPAYGSILLAFISCSRAFIVSCTTREGENSQV